MEKAEEIKLQKEAAQLLEESKGMGLENTGKHHYDDTD